MTPELTDDFIEALQYVNGLASTDPELFEQYVAAFEESCPTIVAYMRNHA